MAPQFHERWFKISSPIAEVDFVVVGRDSLGWKMDVYGHEHNKWPDGDTYQDSLDELLPFLGKYINSASEWADYDSGERLTIWEALTSVTGKLS